MKLPSFRFVAGFLIGYTVTAYAIDVLIEPSLVARKARAAARRRGKPLLNVGAGTSGSSLRVALLGPTAWGDVNCDIAACSLPPQKVSCCDIHKLPYADRQFGAVIASHVLEHVEDPVRALVELQRVADEVYAITPKWWAPHTWAHPGHIWYRRSDGRFVRIRGQRSRL